MNHRQRQAVLLIGFMTMLTVVFLFLFVFNNASAPAIKGPQINASNQTVIGQAVSGWETLIDDVTKGFSATSGG